MTGIYSKEYMFSLLCQNRETILPTVDSYGSLTALHILFFLYKPPKQCVPLLW